MDDFWAGLDEHDTDEPVPDVTFPPDVTETPGAGASAPHPSEFPLLSVSPNPVLELVDPAPLAKAEDPRDRLRQLETEVLEESLGVLSAAMAFPDVLQLDGSPLESPPEDWAEKYGEDGARRRFIVARAATLPAKDAPVGLKMAQQTAVGSMAALERAKTGAPVFNMMFVKMVQPPVFEEIEIVEEK